jgi:hypothetical protein
MIEQLAAGDAVGILDATHLGAWAVVSLREAHRVDGDYGRLADQHAAERLAVG